MTAPMTREELAENERLLFHAAEDAYFKAAETSNPQDWLGAGLLAKQHRNALARLNTDAQSARNQPRVTDDDKSEITVSLDGKELRGWSYKDDAERRIKMLCAREYVEGYCDGRGK
ncbi:hypothetical protein [Bradyrhizobium sp.]